MQDELQKSSCKWAALVMIHSNNQGYVRPRGLASASRPVFSDLGLGPLGLSLGLVCLASASMRTRPRPEKNF